MTQTTQHETAKGGLSSTLGGIARRMCDGDLAGGDRASLRRHRPGSPLPPAYWRLAVGTLEPAEAIDSGRLSNDTDHDWAAILCGLAHLAELHARGRSLGRALAEAGYSERRLDSLLRADESRLRELLPTLARHLDAAGVQVDWTDAARLLFTRGSAATGLRDRLARDYYGSWGADKETDR